MSVVELRKSRILNKLGCLWKSFGTKANNGQDLDNKKCPELKQIEIRIKRECKHVRIVLS